MFADGPIAPSDLSAGLSIIRPARDDDVDRRAPSALTLTDQTPIPVTAQIPIPRYVYVGPDRSAGLDTKEAPAIPTQVVGASSITVLRVVQVGSSLTFDADFPALKFVETPLSGG